MIPRGIFVCLCKVEMRGDGERIRSVVEDHVASLLGERESTAHEGAFFCGAFGAHDHGTGLTEVIGLTSNVADIGLVHMTAKDDLRLDLLAEQSCPFGVGLLLDIEGRFVDLCEGNVRDYDAVGNAFGGIFLGGVCDHVSQKVGLPTTEIRTAVHIAVFRVRIVLVFSAVQHQAPKVPEAEGIVGATVVGGCVIGELLGIDAAHIVISS